MERCTDRPRLARHPHALLSAAMAYEEQARAEGAPSAPEDCRACVAADPHPASAAEVERAPAPGILMSTEPQVAGVTAELAAARPAPLDVAAGADDKSLRASLARMMAADHRWPAPALMPTSYAPGLPGAPRSFRRTFRPLLPPSSFLFPISPLGQCAIRHGGRRLRSWRHAARRVPGGLHLACAEPVVGGAPFPGCVSSATDDPGPIDSARGDRPGRARGVHQRPAEQRGGGRHVFAFGVTGRDAPCTLHAAADAPTRALVQLLFRLLPTPRRCRATRRRRGWRQPPMRARLTAAHPTTSAAGRARRRPSFAACPATSGASRRAFSALCVRSLQ